MDKTVSRTLAGDPRAALGASPRYDLALLGRFELTGPDGPIRFAGKVAGLLALLATNAPQAHTRHKLAALLWGSHFDTQARQNLRQALVTLRRALGEETLVSKGDRIALEHAIVSSDLARFLALIRDGSEAALSEAVDLYRGPFLADIDIAEEAWTDWLTEERQRLETLALDVMVRCGDHELAAGQVDRALDIGRRATGINNLREDCHRLVLRVLAAKGRRADALKHYDQLVALLKRELDVAPDAETSALALELRKPPESADVQAAPIPPSDLQTPPLSPPVRPSIAVLPFINLSGDPDQEYFSDGLTEDIITELSRFSELFVIAGNSSFKYKNRTVANEQVMRELGVRYILGGSFRRGGDRIRITAQLVDASTGVHRWAEHYDRHLSDVFAVQDDLAQTIASLLVAHVKKAEIERTLLKPAATWQAYDYYLRASRALASFLSSFNPQDLYAARRLFEQSLSIDPNYARAMVGLSFTHSLAWVQALDADHLEPKALGRALTLAQKALALDPDLPEGHSHLGNILRLKGDHDIAIAEFEKAMALNPNFTDWRFTAVLVCAAESSRAIEVGKANTRLDPFYPPFAAGWLGLAHYMHKRYAEALPSLRECVSRGPNWGAAHAWLAATYAQLKFTDKARMEAAEVLRINPNYTIEGTQKRVCLFKLRQDAEHLETGLRKAGLPH